MILLLSSFLFLSFSLFLSVSRAQSVFGVCFYEDSVAREEYIKARGSNAKKVVVLVIIVRRTRRENVFARCCGEVFYSFRRDISQLFKNNNTVVVVRASTVGSSKLSLSFSLILIRSAPRPSTLPRQTAAHFSNNTPLTSTKRPR